MNVKKRLAVKYSPVFEEQLKKLEEHSKKEGAKFHNQLLSAILREKENLKSNPHRGIQIQKDRIPNEYITDYGVTNLWKINLPDYWRMIYTITGNELEIISILLEFMDHKEYNKKFGYRGR